MEYVLTCSEAAEILTRHIAQNVMVPRGDGPVAPVTQRPSVVNNPHFPGGKRPAIGGDAQFLHNPGGRPANWLSGQESTPGSSRGRPLRFVELPGSRRHHRTANSSVH